jgi:polyhydroxyalkanoate synthesis regulator phasin
MYEATRERIAQIIGEASMCWSETPKGVFNSEKAKELVDEVMTHIQYPIEHPSKALSTIKDQYRKVHTPRRRKTRGRNRIHRK